MTERTDPSSSDVEHVELEDAVIGWIDQVANAPNEEYRMQIAHALDPPVTPLPAEYTYYDGPAFAGLPLGVLGDHRLPTRIDQLMLTPELLQQIARVGATDSRMPAASTGSQPGRRKLGAATSRRPAAAIGRHVVDSCSGRN